MADVLPPLGNGMYCAAAISGERKYHVFTHTLEELAPHIKRWYKADYDIYFAMATFDPAVEHMRKERRTAKNARAIKAIYIDIDKYDTKAEAGAALYDFIDQTGLAELGKPHVISSGGGLHCYWPLTEPVDIVTWKPIAENFKRLCVQEGFHIDMTATADAARILRVPDTLNHKKVYGTPRRVKLLQEGTGPVDLRRFSAIIRAQLSERYAPISNSFVAHGVSLEGTAPSRAQQRRSAAAEALLGNVTTHFKTIMLRTERGDGCGQLAHYSKNASDDGMEPLWRGLLSWTKVCVDGDEASRELSALHPYPEHRMHAKLAEIKGPYPCIKMDSENPGVCPSCPHWGKITNALALGRDVLTHVEPRQIIVPTNTLKDDNAPEPVLDDDEDDGPGVLQTRKVEIPSPPRGYMYGERGGVYVEVKETDASGVTIKTKVEVLSHDLFVVDLLKMEDGEHRVHMMAIKPTPDGKGKDYISIIMPTKAVVSRDDLLKCLAAHNIYASRGSAMDVHLFGYVRACVNEASQNKKPLDVPVQFGWQRDRTFVYNNRVFRPDGTEHIVPMPGLENLNRVTQARGTVEDWRRPWNLLIDREMWTMLALCIDSFGSTLMHFSNHEGFVWHIGSTASGTGKSLTLSLKAGVWGHPIRYRTSKGTSPVAMQQRAGLLNSLPLLSDEITSKARNDVEWAPAFIFDFAEGQGKERMESSSNKERLNNSTWSSTCTLTSNVHMIDLLTGSRKHSSHGELMRMLEWTPSKELQFDDRERAVLQMLRSNYGVAGEQWIRYCVSNYRKVADLWAQVHTRVRNEFAFTDEERIWHAACTNILTATILLGENYTQLLSVPIKPVVGALKSLVQAARVSYKASIRSAEDVLNAYIREYHGRFVVVRRSSEGDLLTDLGVDITGKTSTKANVMGRVEHGVTHTHLVDFFVEEQLLRQHCAAMSFGFADLKRGLQAMHTEGVHVRFNVRKDMLARVDGPALRVLTMHLTVPKDRLDEDSSTLSVGSR